MVPCSAPPQVQQDSNGCKVTVSPAGDSLTLQLPAASLGLSLFAGRCSHNSNPVAAGVRSSAAAAAAAAAAETEEAVSLGCSCGYDSPRNKSRGSCCSCCLGGVAAAVAPEDASVHELAAAGPPAAAGAAAAGSAGFAVDSNAAAAGCPAAVDELGEGGEQSSCCVVEGDVRILVSSWS
jgi:hypothetical protein